MSLLALILLAEAATGNPPPPVYVPSTRRSSIRCRDDCITPVEAVTYASYLAPKAGIAGTFRMQVKAVGEQKGVFYLNSETDYRDRNCLTIAIPAPVMAELGGGDLAGVKRWFEGRTIWVRGVAGRVRIGFFGDDGKATDKYYYQVQVRIGRQDQIAMGRVGYIDDRELQAK